MLAANLHVDHVGSRRKIERMVQVADDIWGSVQPGLRQAYQLATPSSPSERGGLHAGFLFC